jgi:hypothetical protein
MAIGIFTLRQQLRGLLSTNWPGAKTPYVEYLVVGGGGGGSFNGGGGGAGGVVTGFLPVTAGATNNITVGGGGTGGVTGSRNGGSGVNSVINSVIAVGGGGGGANAVSGVAGASGGGSGAESASAIGGQGVFGQGNIGGNGWTAANGSGAGGGGAGTVGLNAPVISIGGNGGAGISSAISGTVTPYGGGGGGNFNIAVYPSGTRGTGGVGGGGNASSSSGSAGDAGSANTGGGGGAGTSGSGGNGGAGGSGIVIISYPDIYPALTTGGATSPTISTSGSGSIKLTSGQYFYYSAQSGFNFGTGDFTIEFFINPNAVGAGIAHGIISFPVNSTISAPVVYLNGDNSIRYSNYVTETVGSVLSIGTWYHVAASRSSGVTKLFVNGTQEGSNLTDSGNFGVGTNMPVIGASVNSSGAILAVLDAYLSNIRIVKGTALYTSNFTAPTSPLSSITNTQLLLSSNSGAYLADNSTNSYVATGVGPPTWNQLSPFATGLGYKNRVYTWAPTVSAGSSATGTFTV